MVSLEELERLMAVEPEGEHLEFKEAKTQLDSSKLFKYCVALANEGGGKLILGVSNLRPRHVVGTQAFPNPTEAASKIYNKLRFRVEATAIAHPDGRVVVFDVPSRPRGTAYALEGAYLMRSAEDLVPMSEDRLRKIFAEGNPGWLEETAMAGCSAEDIVRLLDTQRYFDLLNLPYPSTREGVVERFESEGLICRKIDQWDILNLGAILFAKRLKDFGSLARKAARVIVYDGPSKLNTRLDIHGQQGYAVGIESLIEYVSSHVPRNEVITKALRYEVKMFPEVAIRELVANALIHQEFTETGTSVMIELYSDRLEISNPGLPPIPPERFIDEYRSRNERLADLMRRMGICEEKGSGIDRVIDSAEFHQLPAPDFRVGALHTYVVLYAHRDFGAMDRNDRVRACYQHCALKYVMNARMTNQTLRERFKLSDKRAESVSRIIGDSLDKGLIKLADPTVKSTRYRSYVPFWA